MSCWWVINKPKQTQGKKENRVKHEKEAFLYGFLQKMWPNPREAAYLGTFTEEIRNGKLHFFVQWVMHKHGSTI